MCVRGGKRLTETQRKPQRSLFFADDDFEGNNNNNKNKQERERRRKNIDKNRANFISHMPKSESQKPTTTH